MPLIAAVRTVVLIIVIAFAGPAMTGTAGAFEEQACREPITARTYTSDSMLLRLELDLHDCDWWDGSPLELIGVVTRDDGEREDFAFSLQACSAIANEGWEDGSVPRFDKVGCTIEVQMDHPTVEVAHYMGGVSYIWDDGPQVWSFDTTCVSSPLQPSCRDDYAPAIRGPGIRTSYFQAAKLSSTPRGLRPITSND
jgi:hypothetical protein